MNRYQKIIILACLGFIILLYVIFGIKRSVLSRQNDAYSSFSMEELKETVSQMQRKLISLEARLEKAEKMPADRSLSRSSAAGTLPFSSPENGIFVNENIFRDNLETKAVWNPTNKPNVFIVTIKLEKEPLPETIFVWTGMGMLPFDAFNVQGQVLSVLMQQSKESFNTGNNYINIRYIPKAK